MTWALDEGVVEPVAAWLGTYLIHGVALFALAALVARFLRSARVREQLWRAALFGPLVTASLQLGAGVDPLGGRWVLPEDTLAGVGSSGGAAATLAEPTMVEVAWIGEFDDDGHFTAEGGDEALASASGVVETLENLWGRNRWQLVATLLVVFGIAALMLRALFEALRMRRLADRARAEDPALLALVASLSERAGLRRPVRVEVTGRGASAYATGVLTPRIVVPAHAVEALDPASLRAMLAHEIGHIVRLDPLWVAAIRSVTALFFFQPLNWVTARKLDECAEFCCDEFAVASTGDEVALARCLATVAEWIVGPGASAAARPVCTMAHSGSPLAERVERILATEGQAAPTPRATRWLGAAAVSATAFSAPGFAVVPAELSWPDMVASAEPVLVALDPAPRELVFEQLSASARALQAEIDLLLELCGERVVDRSTVERLRLLQVQSARLASIASTLETRARERFPVR